MASQLRQQINQAKATPCTAELAQAAVKRLLGCYKDHKVINAENYTYTMIRVFMEYPAAIVMRVVSPVHGLPSRLKYFPNVADVSMALRELNDQLENKLATAWDDESRPQRRPPEPDQRKLKTVEERKAFVKSVLGYEVTKHGRKEPMREFAGRSLIDKEQLFADQAKDEAEMVAKRLTAE